MTEIEKIILICGISIGLIGAGVGAYLKYRNGWELLVKHYLHNGPIPPFIQFGSYRNLPMVSIRRGNLHHGINLRAAADSKGLYLVTDYPMKFFHPPLFILWQDLTDELNEGKVFGFHVRSIKIKFKKEPTVSLNFSEEIVAEIKKYSQNNWVRKTV